MKNAMVVGHQETRQLAEAVRSVIRKSKNGEELTAKDRNKLRRSLKAVKGTCADGLLSSGN